MIAAIVEGLGDDLALNSLMPRIHSGAEITCVPMGGKSNIVREKNGFEETIIRQNALGHDQFYVLLDGDVFFPPYANLKEEKEGMAARAQKLSQDERIAVEVYWAIKVFESWLIGGLRSNHVFCGLRKKLGRIPFDTEVEPVEPVKWLEQRLKRGHYGHVTQGCLAKYFDIPEARRRNASLEAFCTAFNH